MCGMAEDQVEGHQPRKCHTRAWDNGDEVMEAQIAYEGDLSCMATISGGGGRQKAGSCVIPGSVTLTLGQVWLLVEPSLLWNRPMISGWSGKRVVLRRCRTSDWVLNLILTEEQRLPLYISPPDFYYTWNSSSWRSRARSIDLSRAVRGPCSQKGVRKASEWWLTGIAILGSFFKISDLRTGCLIKHFPTQLQM